MLMNNYYALSTCQFHFNFSYLTKISITSKKYYYSDINFIKYPSSNR